MLFSSINFCSNKIESYYKDIYLKTNNNFRNQQELYIDKIVFDNKIIESYEIYNNNIPLPVKITKNNKTIKNISFYFKNNYKIEKISKKTQTGTEVIQGKLNDKGTIISNIDIDINKIHTYFITIKKDNDSNTIEYELDFTDTKYYKERDNTMENCSNSDYYKNYIHNNNDDLLNQLDCNDSYIKDIRKDKSNKNVYSVFDDNNNFQHAYIYSNTKPPNDYKLCDNNKCPDIFTSNNKITIENEQQLLQIKHNLESYKIPKKVVYKALGELFKKNDLSINILGNFINRLKLDENFEYIKDLIDGRTLEYCLDNSMSLQELYSKLKDISKVKINGALYYLSIYKNSKYKKDLVKNSLLVEKNNKTEIPLFIEVFRYMSLEQKRLYINNKKNSNKTGENKELINFLLKVQLSIHLDTNSYLQNHEIKKIEIFNIDNLISEDENFKQKYWGLFTTKYLKDVNYYNFYKSYYILIDYSSKTKEKKYCNLLLQKIRESSKQPIETLLEMAKSKNIIYEKCINNESSSISDLISKINQKYEADNWENNIQNSEKYLERILNFFGDTDLKPNNIKLITPQIGGNINSEKDGKNKLKEHIKLHRQTSSDKLKHYIKQNYILEEESSNYNEEWIKHDIYHTHSKKTESDFHNYKTYEEYKNESVIANKNLKLNTELFKLISDFNRKEIKNICSKLITNTDLILNQDTLNKINKVLDYEKKNGTYILKINTLVSYFYSLIKYKKYTRQRGENTDIKGILDYINTIHENTLQLFDELIKIYNIIINENIRNKSNSTLIYTLFIEINQLDIIKNNIDTLVKNVNSKYSYFTLEKKMTGGMVNLSEIKYKILWDSYFLNKINPNKKTITELIKKHPNDFNRYIIYNYKNNFNLYKDFFINDLNKLLDLRNMLEPNIPLYSDISLIINNINNVNNVNTKKTNIDKKKINIDNSKNKKLDSLEVENILNNDMLKQKNNKIKGLEDKIDNLKNNILVQQNSINLRELNLKKQTRQLLDINKIEKQPVKKQDIINYLIKDKSIVKDKKYILELDSLNNIQFKSNNEQLDIDIADKEKEINALNISYSNNEDLGKIRDFFIAQKQIELKKIEDNKKRESYTQIEENAKQTLEEDNKLKSNYESMKKKNNIILQEYNELQTSYKAIKKTINKAIEFDLTLNVININTENKAIIKKSIADKFNIPIDNLYLKKIVNSNLLGGSPNKKISIIIYNEPIDNITTKINNLITVLSGGTEIKLGNFKIINIDTPKNINLSDFQIQIIKDQLSKSQIISNNPKATPPQIETAVATAPQTKTVVATQATATAPAVATQATSTAPAPAGATQAISTQIATPVTAAATQIATPVATQAATQAAAQAAATLEETSSQINNISDSNNLLKQKSESNQILLNNTQLELDKTNETIKKQNNKLKELDKLLLKYKINNDKGKIKNVENKKTILIKTQKKVIEDKDILQNNKYKLIKKQTLINEEKSSVEQKNELNSQDNYIKKQLESQEKVLNKQKVNEIEELTNKQDELNINQQNEINNMIKEEKTETLEEENKRKIEIIKKNNECKVKRYDCLANNRDIYTIYKQDYKYLKNWSFDVTDNENSLQNNSSDSQCGLKNDCSVCPMLSSGIPNSVDLSKKNKTISDECLYESCNDCFYDKNYIEYKKAYDKNKLNKYKKGYK